MAAALFIQYTVMFKKVAVACEHVLTNNVHKTACSGQ